MSQEGETRDVAGICCNEHVAAKVVYEFAMFTFLCNELRFLFSETITFKPGDVTYLGTGGTSTKETHFTFALLESFLLHTRVLHDFFYKRRGRDDDVVAADFVPKWEVLRPAKGEYLGDPERYDRLNKALAHLTILRVNYDSNEKQWNVDAIRDEIEIAMSQFIQSLPLDTALSDI